MMYNKLLGMAQGIIAPKSTNKQTMEGLFYTDLFKFEITMLVTKELLTRHISYP